MGLVWLPWSR